MLEPRVEVEYAPSASEAAEVAPDEVALLRRQLAERTRQLEASESSFMDAAEAAQRQAEILALYSHDLRTPLAAIVGYADLLEMGVPEAIPDCALECVSRIREAALHLQVLIDQALAIENRG